MGSALDAVLNLKQQETARQQQASDNLTQGLSMLNQSIQQNQANQLAQLQYKAGLAEKGLIPDNTKAGGFRYDPTLTSPLANILTATKLQADAKTAGNKSVYDMAGGVLNGLTGSPSQSIPANSAIGKTLQSIPSDVNIAINNPMGSAAATVGEMTPTSQTSSTDPITGLTTGSTTLTNIPAKVAETKATDIAKEQANAQIGSARDTAQLQMVAQGIKNMNEIHKELSDKGAAGNSLANLILNNYQHIPNKDIQNKVVPPDIQKLSGKFTSARNETLVKVQPILSQQFGQAGTSRIMESLINLSKGEFGDLSTPHAQFEGQAEGTLGSLFRIKIASDKYLEELKKSGQKIPTDEKEVINGIYSNMADLSPEQQKQLNGLVENTLGKSNALPNGITESDIQHTLKLHPEITREQLLKKLGK